MSSATVLIADDSPLVLRMIEKMLAGAGLSVLTAADGLEAVEKALAREVDLVILDVSMPRMNGYQACRLLKSEPLTRGVPVIILTSKDQAGDRFWGIETGADYYVTKDAEPQRILDLVRNVLEAGRQAQHPPGSERPRASADVLSRVNELLDRKLYEATILSEIGRVARNVAELDETFTSVMALVARVVDFALGAMAFVDGDELEVLIAAQRPALPPVVDETKQRLLAAIALQRGGAGFARVSARLFSPRGGATGPLEAGLGGFLAYPIMTGGTLSGLMALSGRAAARVSAENDAFLSQVANQAHIVTENSRLVQRLKRLAVRDGLTDLFNHRHTHELLVKECDRVGRYSGAVSVLMVDIDHFKLINDGFGHPAGDGVLREVARLMKEVARNVDLVGRYGGEEFVFILPQTEYPDALKMGERLRRAVEEHPFHAPGEPIRVTVSIGVATYPSPQVAAPGDLVREADRALYRAKEAGRNRVA
ncbi:MAG: diguanylate cyclase [Vicinamibacteria bacterium]